MMSCFLFFFVKTCSLVHGAAVCYICAQKAVFCQQDKLVQNTCTINIVMFTLQKSHHVKKKEFLAHQKVHLVTFGIDGLTGTMVRISICFLTLLKMAKKPTFPKVGVSL